MAPARKRAAAKSKKGAAAMTMQDKDSETATETAETKQHPRTSTNNAADGTEPVSTEPKESITVVTVDNDSKKAVKTRKAAPRKAKAKTDYNALPHGLSVTISKEDAVTDQKLATDNAKAAAVHDGSLDNPLDQEKKNAAPVRKPRSRKNAKAIKTDEDLYKDADGPASPDSAEDPEAKARKPKTAAQYGVKLGRTPYPELMHPTKEESEIVRALLAKAHPQVKFSQPEAPPIPSRTVAGCGEVPCVLEALIRTYMSSHTSMGNANLAIQGLLKRYPSITTGRAVGSVDWNSVRLNSREDLEVAIRAGGMAPTKSKHIKALLDMVFAENAAMREEIEKKRAQGSSAPTVAVSDDPLPGDAAGVAAMERLADEILTSSPDVLTLDYLHALGAEEAFVKLLPYPGIGVKTAACTLLFCMQRPCFAVDTHVFRLCKWLGWAPANATRDTTFAHCDVRVPDAEKYALHQLMIAHGKECVRCRAGSTERTEGWDEAECVIEALVQRTDKKMDGSDASPGRKRKRAKAEALKNGKAEEGTDDEEAEQHEEEEVDAEEQGSPAKKPRSSKAKESAVDPETGAAPESAKPKSLSKRKAPEKEQGDDSDDGDFAPSAAKKTTKRAAAARGKKGAKAKAEVTLENDDATAAAVDNGIEQHAGEDVVDSPADPSGNSTLSTKRVLPSRRKTPKSNS